MLEQRPSDRNRCETDRAWPFNANDGVRLELGLKDMRATQPISLDSNGRYVAQIATLRVLPADSRRVQQWREAGRVVRPRPGFDFVVVDFLVKNTGQFPNCTVFNVTLKTDFFGEVTRERSIVHPELERLPTGADVNIRAVFEVDRRRQPLGVMLSARSDDTCRSAFQPRLPEIPSVLALIPLSR